MTVYELTEEELAELKGSMYWAFANEDSMWYDPNAEKLVEDIDHPNQIPNEMIYEYFDGIDFVEEDFFCNT